MVHVAGHDWRVLRLQPPLDISEERLMGFVEACREELAALGSLT
jgi:acetylornithine/succinyldiaminopimelate/putrescine aminotransferase